MTIDTQQFKTAYRIDGNDDDTLISMYLDTAKNFVKNAIGTDEAFFTDQKVATMLDTAILALAGTYYQYRLSQSDVETFNVDATCNSIIGQLRSAYSVFEESKDAKENTT